MGTTTVPHRSYHGSDLGLTTAQRSVSYRCGMNRHLATTAALALGTTLALSGCMVVSDDGVTMGLEQEAALTGTEKIDVDGRSVNISCSGQPAGDRPVVVLLHGGGEDLTTFADLQKTLSKDGTICSYDRLGAGASDAPDGPQSLDDAGEVLSRVIDRVAGDAPVVLAGHSLGGVIAGRYAPEHPDDVAGLVLMDATSPTQLADFEATVPADATGDAAVQRDATLAALGGKNPEMLAVPDGKVRSAGDIPVEIVQHGQQYLAAIGKEGPAMEQAWADGQRAWLALSERSNLTTAADSGHYIHQDEPDVAARAIDRITDAAS